MFSPMLITSLISHLNFKTPLLHLLLHVTGLTTTPPPKQCPLLFHQANEKTILILTAKMPNILALQVRPKKKIKILLHSFQFLYFPYPKKKKNSQYIHFAFKYLKTTKERAKHATALVRYYHAQWVWIFTQKLDLIFLIFSLCSILPEFFGM